jgi:hypothetical protein
MAKKKAANDSPKSPLAARPGTQPRGKRKVARYVTNVETGEKQRAYKAAIGRTTRTRVRDEKAKPKTYKRVLGKGGLKKKRTQKRVETRKTNKSAISAAKADLRKSLGRAMIASKGNLDKAKKSAIFKESSARVLEWLNSTSSSPEAANKNFEAMVKKFTSQYERFSNNTKEKLKAKGMTDKQIASAMNKDGGSLWDKAADTLTKRGSGKNDKRNESSNADQSKSNTATQRKRSGTVYAITKGGRSDKLIAKSAGFGKSYKSETVTSKKKVAEPKVAKGRQRAASSPRSSTGTKKTATKKVKK